jgi:hypothetical protein
MLLREFGKFNAINISYYRHSLKVLKRCLNVSNRHTFSPFHSNKQYILLHNLSFAVGYLRKMFKYRGNLVTVSTIEQTLSSLFPESRVVGDKYPRYILLLDKLMRSDNTNFLVIYRDCRDVVSSTLKQVRTAWSHLPFAKNVDTAEKVAHRWVKAIKMMDFYKDKLHVIRYEHLVQDPKSEFEVLGKWLGVDPAGFPVARIRDTSIGKHRKGLSNQELEIVMAIAGPTMSRLGYI